MKETNETQGAPHIAVQAQYTKDFSFENPNAPSSLVGIDKTPQIDLSLDLNIQKTLKREQIRKSHMGTSHTHLMREEEKPTCPTCPS